MWPGGPWKPAVLATSSWERGSSYPGPAAVALLPFIYIPEKEPAAAAACSSCGLWATSWAPSRFPTAVQECVGPCPASAAGQWLEKLAPCMGIGAV